MCSTIDFLATPLLSSTIELNETKTENRSGKSRDATEAIKPDYFPHIIP